MSGVQEPSSLQERKVFVAGHRMAGAAIVRRLARARGAR